MRCSAAYMQLALTVKQMSSKGDCSGALPARWLPEMVRRVRFCRAAAAGRVPCSSTIASAARSSLLSWAQRHCVGPTVSWLKSSCKDVRDADESADGSCPAE